MAPQAAAIRLEQVEECLNTLKKIDDPPPPDARKDQERLNGVTQRCRVLEDNVATALALAAVPKENLDTSQRQGLEAALRAAQTKSATAQAELATLEPERKRLVKKITEAEAARPRPMETAAFSQAQQSLRLLLARNQWAQAEKQLRELAGGGALTPLQANCLQADLVLYRDRGAAPFAAAMGTGTK